MNIFFATGLSVFVIGVIVLFFIFSTLAISGRFDHWNSRFINRFKGAFNRVRRFFRRRHKRNESHRQLNDDSRHMHHAHHETHTQTGNIS